MCGLDGFCVNSTFTNILNEKTGDMFNTFLLVYTFYLSDMVKVATAKHESNCKKEEKTLM